jgi:hypothetical protein
MHRLHSSWRTIAERALQGRVTACPNCGDADYEISEVVDVPLAYREQATVGSGGRNVVPMLIIVCLGCSGIRLFSAKGLGLVVTV